MKATELMIGDWVEYSSKHKHGMGKIAGIEPREGSEEPTTFTVIDDNLMLVGVSRVNVKPIPLTPNILENKFSCTNYTFEGETYKSFSSIGDGTQVVTVCFQSFGGIEVEIATRKSHLITTAIEYVHQLQRAMRLCGIEKTIEL